MKRISKPTIALLVGLPLAGISLGTGKVLSAMGGGGQELGRCGNSGNSDAPHIHMHLQDTPTLNQGNGQNMTFKGINAELSGKIFKNVDWPLIRGLFVWN